MIVHTATRASIMPNYLIVLSLTVRSKMISGSRSWGLVFAVHDLTFASVAEKLYRGFNRHWSMLVLTATGGSGFVNRMPSERTIT